MLIRNDFEKDLIKIMLGLIFILLILLIISILLKPNIYCQCSPCECKICDCTNDMPYPNFDKSIYDNKTIEY